MHKKLSGRRNQKERIYDRLKKRAGQFAPPAFFLETLAKRIVICYNKKGKRGICFYQP